MRKAHSYARKNGIILKGDIPIGISRNSVETWSEHQYFDMDSQSGAPPDDFSCTGQNWEFPVYKWDVMRNDRYKWWINRLKKMSEYFDAYRIDHILGFFRIWEIPISSIQALLGYFNPALPFSPEEIKQYGFSMYYNRFLKPHINRRSIKKYFGKYSSYACKKFLNPISNDIFELKQEFITQEKIEKYFLKKGVDEKKNILKTGLFHLTSNVLFIEDPQKHGCFYPRICAQSTDLYKELDNCQQQAFNKIYDDFFYHRNEDLWKSKAIEKLSVLINETNMLACGEDLGMIPLCVSEVMSDLHVLTIEIQRMPKRSGIEFGNIGNYPYQSVCTTSSHDTSTIRGWWEEDAEITQHYYKQILQRNGMAPKKCSVLHHRSLTAEP